MCTWTPSWSLCRHLHPPAVSPALVCVCSCCVHVDPYLEVCLLSNNIKTCRGSQRWKCLTYFQALTSQISLSNNFSFFIPFAKSLFTFEDFLIKTSLHFINKSLVYRLNQKVLCRSAAWRIIPEGWNGIVSILKVTGVWKAMFTMHGWTTLQPDESEARGRGGGG